MPHNQHSHSLDNDPLTTPPRPQSLAQLHESIVSLRPQNHSEHQLESLIERISAVATAKGGILRIGMYDGSFDPPHYGHIETVRAAVPLAGLDLVVMNCHPKPNSIKPNLSPHHLRTEMVSSYLAGEPTTIVSPLSRAVIEKLLIPHRVVGIIGSDTLQRFLREGIAHDFNTDEIVVSERQDAPLTNAPVTLEGRPVWYLGRTTLAFNDTSSTAIRGALSNEGDDYIPPRLNTTTARIAREHRLYADTRAPAANIDSPPHTGREHPPFSIPEMYAGCDVVQRVGLENGLLSESFIFEVKDPSGEVIAFMKTLPPERNSLTHLRDEAHGLALFNKLGLRSATAPEAHLCHEPPSLWIERAPGATPGSLLIQYERGTIPSIVVCDCLKAIGTCLKELHTRHSQPFDPKAAELLETYIAHHEDLLERIPPHKLQDRNLQQTVSIFREEARYLRTHGAHCALIHGDASCSNFLWDTLTGRLSVIDLQRLGTQARAGAPAFATCEYQAFLNTLSYFPNIGFTGLRGGLENAHTAYQAGYGPVDPHELRFFTCLRSIRKAIAGHERIHEITRPALFSTYTRET